MAPFNCQPGRVLRPVGEDRREHCALVLIGRHLSCSVSDIPFQRLPIGIRPQDLGTFPSAQDDALAAFGNQALTRQSAVDSFPAGLLTTFLLGFSLDSRIDIGRRPVMELLVFSLIYRVSLFQIQSYDATSVRKPKYACPLRTATSRISLEKFILTMFR